MKKLFIIGLALFLLSCEGEKKKPIYVDADFQEEYLSATYDDEIEVPFRNVNGIKYVSVKVNGVGFDMIFDTGCSGALISIAEANYLYQKGKLSEEDILGVTTSQIADGSITVNTVVNLKEVIINDQIRCPNVIATVSDNINAPLLLGNAVLDRSASITIDNDKSVLIFKIK